MKLRQEFRGLKSDMKVRASIYFLLLFAVCRNSLALVEFPKSCLSSEDKVCHFGTVKKISSYKTDDLHISLGKNALLKKEMGRIEWVQGPVLFEVSSASSVLFKKNVILVQKGKYLFFGDEYKLKVEVLDGNLQIGKYQVTEGFQATFVLKEDLSIVLEPLQAIDLKDHLVRYVSIKGLSKSQAEEYLEEFSPKHKNYLNWVSELNDSLMKRSLAHEQENERDARAIKERAWLVQKKRKQDYFNKVFER